MRNKNILAGTHCSVHTIRLLLEPTTEQRVHLMNLLQDFKNQCNLISEMNRELKLTNYVKLNKLCYPSVKLTSTAPNVFTQQAARQVAGAYKSLVTRVRNLTRKVKWLEDNNKKVRKVLRQQLERVMSSRPNYEHRNSVILTKDVMRVNQSALAVKLSTTSGRQLISITDSEFNRKQLSGVKILSNAGGTLVHDKRKDRWYLHVPIKQVISTRMGHVVGLDIGITDLIATSYGELPVDKQQYNDLMLRIGKYKSHVARLQSNNSRSAKRKLRQVTGRRRRAVRDFVHCISKKLTEELRLSGASIIVMERLNGIRDLAKRSQQAGLASWFFHLLQRCIEYKAGMRGMLTLYVNPAGTSTTCSSCKSTDTIRDSKNFTCNSCKNYITDADINAAVNIRDVAELPQIVSANAVALIRSYFIDKSYKRSREGSRAAVNQPTAA